MEAVRHTYNQCIVSTDVQLDLISQCTLLIKNISAVRQRYIAIKEPKCISQIHVHHGRLHILLELSSVSHPGVYFM